MNKKQIFDQVTDMEMQIGALYEQLGDLKQQLGELVEEKHRLALENDFLHQRLNEKHGKSNQTIGEQSEITKDLPIPGEGYDNLARLYEEGFHICNMQFGTPRGKEDCLFCLEFLNKTK